MLVPSIFITQLQTMFGEINPKQETKEKLLKLRQISNILNYITIF